MKEIALRIVEARGRSMYPLIPDRAQVGIVAVQPQDLIPGVIVAFTSGKETILHRIIDTKGSGDELRIREKGDNVRTSTWIEAKNCLGRAIWATSRGVTRSLDADVTWMRVRLLTLLSRWEGNVFDILLRMAHAIWRGPFPPVARFGAVVLSWALIPFKVVIAPILLSAYRSRVGTNEVWVGGRLLEIFQELARGEHVQVPSIPEEIGWKTLLDAVAWHGLDQLVAHQMTDSGAGSHPPELANELKFMRYRGAMSQVTGQATLQEVVRVLQDHSVPYAVLKGVPLAIELYGDEALRLSGDMDVLVRRADRDLALAALHAAGYIERGARIQQALVKRVHFHSVVKAQHKGRLIVELHWALVDRANLYRMENDELFTRLRQVKAGPCDVSVLSLEDEFIYLCLHAAKHGLFNAWALRRGESALWYCRSISGNRLIWFLDMHRFLLRHRDKLRMDIMRERIRQWNVADDVGRCLSILDLLVPDSEASHALRALDLERAGARRTDLIQSGHGQRARSESLFMERMMQADTGFVIRPARLLTMRRWLLPSPRDLKQYYTSSPTWKLPWLYLAHPFRMMRRMFCE